MNKTDSTVAKANDIAKIAPEKNTILKAEVPGDFSALVPVDVLIRKVKTFMKNMG